MTKRDNNDVKQIITQIKRDNRTCNEAIDNDHLNCLIYAHENGCPWDEDTCLEAAFDGLLKCLKYVKISVNACK